MLFHFDVANSITADHSFHLEAADLMEAHVKALEFVRELEAEIKRRTGDDFDPGLRLTGVSCANPEMTDKEAVQNYTDWVIDAICEEVAEEE